MKKIYLLTTALFCVSLVKAQWNETENGKVTTQDNVGIGTTDPNYLLDVGGTINASRILLNGKVLNGNEKISTHISFDSNTVEDISGNNYMVVNNGSNPTTDKDGNSNNARIFDGTNDYLVVNELLFAGDFSVNLWHDFATKISADIVGKYNASNLDGWKLYFPNNGNTLRFIDKYQYGSSQLLDINVSAYTGWHMVTIRVSGLTKSIFIDGQKVGENTVVSFNYGTSEPLQVGYNGTYFLNGKIDDISFFEKALSDQEINSLQSGVDHLITDTDYWIPQATDLIYSNGNVFIGENLSSNGDYKLFVETGILTEEVKIQLKSNWPDFVFGDDYQLPSLEEVEEYINTNKHLPIIPSEKEVHEEGIKLGEMNGKLLQKIEELTLYMIEMNKEMKQYREEIKLIKQENQELKSEVSALRNN